MRVTTDQVERFLERLSQNKVEGEEIQTLTVNDLDIINAYLAGRVRAFKRVLFSPDAADVHSSFSGDRTRVRRTYSESEVLSEFGITDSPDDEI